MAQSPSQGLMRPPDEVREMRIRVEDLPPPVPATSLGLPQRLDPKHLPKPMSLAMQHALEQSLRPRVLELFAIHRPAPPFRATNLVYRGHAIWLQSSETGPAQLLTTLDWVDGAHALYVLVPDAPSPDLSGKRIHAAHDSSPHRRSLDAMTAGRGASSIPAELHHRLLAVDLLQPNRHYNLTLLQESVAKPQDAPQGTASRLVAPSQALILSKDAVHPGGRTFGFAPLLSPSLAECQILSGAPTHEALAFYLATTFPGILGAPLVDDDGLLRAINAFRDPTNPKLTRAIAAGAIASYLAWTGGSR